MEIWGGLECTINRVGENYFDQFEFSGHYKRESDLKLICDLGIQKIRYPILWEKHQATENGKIVWHGEKNLNYFKQRNVDVIAGLVHHGSGPKFAPLPTEDFAEKLAIYAGKVAAKFPWINYYTPINEPLTTARFCGLYGLWHPHAKSDLSFLEILLTECKATILAMLAIREINPNAKLVVTEDLAHIHSTPKLKAQADFENKRRWLSLDLICGRVNDQHPLWTYMIDSGIAEEKLAFFLANAMAPDLIGFNYYITSERFLDDEIRQYPAHLQGGNGHQKYVDIEAVRSEKTELIGLKELLIEAYNRYEIPLAITEAHLHCTREEQLRWINHIYETANQIESLGIPLTAVTMWSLFGAYGWDKLLTSANGNYEAGAFDLSGGIPRPTAIAKQLKSLAHQIPFKHPLLGCKGWWERPQRFFAGHLDPHTEFFDKNCPPLLLLGANTAFRNEIVKNCDHRGIHYKTVSTEEINLSDTSALHHLIKKLKPWAVANMTNDCITDLSQLLHVAKICNEVCIPLLTFSTEFLYNDSSNHQHIYDQHKAEVALRLSNLGQLIVRTKALFKADGDRNSTTEITPKKSASPIYLSHFINGSLDLLIDEACGVWQMEDENYLFKPVSTPEIVLNSIAQRSINNKPNLPLKDEHVEHALRVAN